jgi:glycosyltransferase involved in cell wall biosynthesis
MRIAFVCGFAWEPKGTARARAFPLAVELVKRRHEVTLFLTPYDNPVDSGKCHDAEGVQIHNIDVGSWPRIRHIPLLVRRLCRAIEAYSPDVMHFFKPKGYAGAACTWFLVKGNPGIVLDCDDWEGWGGWNDSKSYPWALKEYIDWQEKWLVRRVPIVTAASRALVERSRQLRKSDESVFYVPNCAASGQNAIAQEKALSMTAPEAKALFGLPSGPTIFYSGEFEPLDDVMFFCRAAATAVGDFGAAIVFVGDRQNNGEIHEFFAKQSIQVHFFPRLPYGEFVALIAASDIAAFPYLDKPIYRAKCSARIVDYMSMGKAIVSTAVGQNSDYIVHDESGILAPPGDEAAFARQLKRLLADADLRASLGRNARLRIKEKFSWSAEPLENCLTAYRHAFAG